MSELDDIFLLENFKIQKILRKEASTNSLKINFRNVYE